MVCDEGERKHDNNENSEENELCPKLEHKTLPFNWMKLQLN
jgi:hypothetical protein